MRTALTTLLVSSDTVEQFELPVFNGDVIAWETAFAGLNRRFSQLGAQLKLTYLYELAYVILQRRKSPVIEGVKLDQFKDDFDVDQKLESEATPSADGEPAATATDPTQPAVSSEPLSPPVSLPVEPLSIGNESLTATPVSGQLS